MLNSVGERTPLCGTPVLIEVVWMCGFYMLCRLAMNLMIYDSLFITLSLHFSLSCTSSFDLKFCHIHFYTL